MPHALVPLVEALPQFESVPRIRLRREGPQPSVLRAQEHSALEPQVGDQSRLQG